MDLGSSKNSMQNKCPKKIPKTNKRNQNNNINNNKKKNPTPRHTIVKLQKIKDKERLLSETEKKQRPKHLTHREANTGITSNLSLETTEASSVY